MNLYLRLLWLLLTARQRTRVTALGPCETRFTVLFNDLDVLRHMNNGRYFSIMDLARVDLLLRADLWPRLKERGWYPVVIYETMRFRRSLKLFDRYTVRTRVTSWDDKDILLEQVFVRDATEIGEATVTARFLKRSGGSVAPSEVLALAGIPTPARSTP